MRTRRHFVGSLTAGGAIVLGWNPVQRSWITEASAAEPFDELPPLDGSLHTDPTTLDAFADDFGGIVSRTPMAVLVPGSVNDIVEMVRFARGRGIGVAMNGQAGTDDSRESHSQLGQAQVAGGIVIDAKGLSTIHGIDEEARFADVDAGVRWSDLYDAAEVFGLAPAVMNDYMHLSVGGTLSVGGIGGHAQKFGIQGDNVLELDVVTGAGDLLTCSPTCRRHLFDAVRAGCGQVAIIVRARLRLVPARAMARIFLLFYDDITTYVEDQVMLVGDGRFDYQEGQIVRNDDNTAWRYMIEVAKYFDPPDSPDDAPLLAGLRDDRDDAQIADVTYREWQFRIDPQLAFLKTIGLWETPHPWLDLFIPGAEAAWFVGALFEMLTPEDVGGPVLFYPVPTAAIDVPLFRLPDDPIAFQLDLLRFPPAVPEVVATMLADNRWIHDAAVQIGGTRYVISAIPDFTSQEWRHHFQPRWGLLSSAKHRFDPDNVLTPGWGIF